MRRPGQGSTEPPWWESGTAPEAVFTGRWRRYRVPLVLSAVMCGVVLLVFFVWIGVAAQRA